MKSLYTIYRPTKWDEVVGQESIIKILKQQIETSEIFNCMIFSGTSGTGKTTLARIFANELNKGNGSPIEIDAASNNGVENVRQVTATAVERSLDSEYKVIIIDECHMMSTAAWNAFLKCIEEPPYYTVFIFCTTDPHKIPATIQNRCMRFNFSRVPSYLIEQRLNQICIAENYENYGDVTNYISRICDGEVRKGISYLETCLRYDTELSVDNALKALGNSTYNDYFFIINNLIDANRGELIKKIDEIYNNGVDLKRFVDSFIEFTFDLLTYIECGNIRMTKIPDTYQSTLDFTIKFKDNVDYFNYFIDKLFILKNMEIDRATVQIVFNQMSRFV